MTTQANYILKAVVGGETYLFEYHDTVNVWDTLEDFWHEDYSEVLIDKKDSGLFPIEVQAMENGRVLTTYRLTFNAGVFHAYYDHGRTVSGIYTLDQFIEDCKMTEHQQPQEEKKLMLLCSYDEDERDHGTLLAVSRERFKNDPAAVRKAIAEHFEPANDEDEQELKECIDDLMQEQSGYYGSEYYWKELQVLL